MSCCYEYSVTSQRRFWASGILPSTFPFHLQPPTAKPCGETGVLKPLNCNSAGAQFGSPRPIKASCSFDFPSEIARPAILEPSTRGGSATGDGSTLCEA